MRTTRNTNNFLTFNFVKHEAYLADRSLNLTPTEFKILGVLVKEPGRVFPIFRWED